MLNKIGYWWHSSSTATPVQYPVPLAGAAAPAATPAELDARLAREYAFFSFRRDLAPPIAGRGGAAHTTDAGWGCLLRCMQMLLAHFILRRGLGGDDGGGSDGASDAARALPSLFSDAPPGPLSVAAMVSAVCDGAEGGFGGQFFSPAEGAAAAQRCVRGASRGGAFGRGVAVAAALGQADTGVVYGGEVAAALAGGAAAALVLCPVRVQASERLAADGAAVAELLRLLALPQCEGLLAGAGARCFFVLGGDAAHAYYMDPHMCVQRALRPRSDPAALRPTAARHLHCCPWSALDTSVCLAFSCASEGEWLRDVAPQLEGPFLHVSAHRPRPPAAAAAAPFLAPSHSQSSYTAAPLSASSSGGRYVSQLRPDSPPPPPLPHSMQQTASVVAASEVTPPDSTASVKLMSSANSRVPLDDGWIILELPHGAQQASS